MTWPRGQWRLLPLLAGVALVLSAPVGEARRRPAPGPQLTAPPLPPSGPRPPWPRRARSGVKVLPLWVQQLTPAARRSLGIDAGELIKMGLPPRRLRQLGVRPRGQGLIDPSQWPAEPPSTSPVDPGRLGQAMQRLCPVLIAPRRVQRYAGWITRYSRRFGVDPLLLAALIYQQSRCHARAHNAWGLGLTMINPAMHRPRIKQGRYRYWALKGGAWRPAQQPLDRFPFTRASLLRPEPNIYFAAGILGTIGEQCPHACGWFGSVHHRHPVSHFVWGDRVRGAGAEDRILRARRRLLAYYSGAPQVPLARFEGLPLHSPLDGPPLKVTSGFGDDRDGGSRRHTGVDFASDTGEPVRAIADGVVTLAGVDRGHNRLRSLDPRLTRRVPPRRIGKRGLLVTIAHARDLSSEYMHLSAYVVRTGQRVKGGQLIGYVGRSGIKESDAHLHFGLRHHGVNRDPVPCLRPYAFPQQATYIGRNNLHRRVERQTRRERRQLRQLRTRLRGRSGRRGRAARRPWVGGPSRPTRDRPASP